MSSWKPYLFDVAFQRHVIQQCHPQWKIQAFLMMADKSREAQVEGLNQLFRIYWIPKMIPRYIFSFLCLNFSHPPCHTSSSINTP